MKNGTEGETSARDRQGGERGKVYKRTGREKGRERKGDAILLAVLLLKEKVTEGHWCYG
jgi:hypothetical protein